MEPTVSGGEDPGEGPHQVLADLRRARRQRRTQDFDVFEAAYRVYITAIVSGIAVWLLSGVTGDSRVGSAAAHYVGAHDAALVGLAIALCWAIGLRSGGRGGPLVIEAADVRHVLLSPVNRAITLRPVAVRQLRFGGFIGVGAGTIAGLLAYRRLPGSAPAWLLTGAIVGGLTVVSSLGLAMLVAGRRLGRLVGTGLATAVLGWSVADVIAHVTTSPATLLGELALWPLRFRVTGVIGAVVALAAVGAGLVLVAGSSLEAAEQRATLVGQIRFAATLRDLRTVVVLRRQLAQELPRQRPWIRMPRSVPIEWTPGVGQRADHAQAPGGAHVANSQAPGGAHAANSQAPGGVPSVPSVAPLRRWPIWRRGWHGILRFPGLRFVRLAVLGVAAGVATLGAWRGTTPLLVLAGICLYVAGLDAVEPLAQEIDHPDRRDGYALANGELEVRQLGPSVVLMAVVAMCGLLAAYVGSGLASRALELGAVMVVPAALAGLAGAAISVIQGAPTPFSSTDSMLPPEAAGARAIVRIVWPPAVAVAGVLPLLAGRHLRAGRSSVRAVADLEPLILILVMLVGMWVRYREDIHAWFRRTMDEAKSAQRPAPTP